MSILNLGLVFFFILYIEYLSVFDSLKRELYIFLGYCTEFNVAGGVIQNHFDSPCGSKSYPRCNDIYRSSDAYKCKELNNTHTFMGLT